MKTPRLLFVCHNFPPNATISSFRARRIAIHMERRGWHVRAVAARALYQLVVDEALCEGLEAVEVQRTHSLEVRAWLSHWRGEGGGAASTSVAAATSGEAPEPGGLRRGLAAIWRWVQAFEIPDRRFGWIPFAFWAGARGERPDVVLATMPSWTNAAVAALLAAWHRSPLVLDFRDPRARDPRDPWLGHWLEDRVDDAAARRATRIVATTEGLAGRIRARYERDIDVVTNACEPERFEGVAPRHFDRPMLVYAGGLYGGRMLDPVLDALAALRDEGRLRPEQLGLLYMGRTPELAAGPTAARGLEAFVTVEGVRPNRESLEACRGAACNLTLVGAEHVRQIPAKIFEHIGARRPMLVLVPPGSDTAALLQPIPWARCVSTDDPEGLKDAILEVASGALAEAQGDVPESLTVDATMGAFDAILREAAASRG